MGIAVIREEASGAVTWNEGGRERLFVPDYDLEAATRLLFRMYGLPSDTGKRLKDNYWRDGLNWFGGQVHYLYYRLIYRYVQYRELLERFARDKVRPVFADKGNFHQIWSALHPRFKWNLFSRWPYRVTLPRHNQAVAAGPKVDFLFYRYGPRDFRTKEMLAHFEERNQNFAFVYAPSRSIIRDRNSYGHPAYLLYSRTPSDDSFRNKYDFSGFSGLERDFAQRAVTLIEEGMSRQYREYLQHRANLSVWRPRLFFALEDILRLYPLLFACRSLGIPTVGYQTGVYSSHLATHALEGWEEGEFQYFDHLIVWGSFWEGVLCKKTSAYPADCFLVGANKHTYSYKRLDSPEFDAKNVLIPYEYLANTRAMGRYMVRLMDAGYRIFFKLKPDWEPERQLACYGLPPDYEARVECVVQITDELMARINIVAGSMTTLLYDLLPYGKHTWLLDTEYTLLADMAEAGYARVVRLEEIDALPEPEKADLHHDYAAVFNPATLAEVLDRHVLGRLG